MRLRQLSLLLGMGCSSLTGLDALETIVPETTAAGDASVPPPSSRPDGSTTVTPIPDDGSTPLDDSGSEPQPDGSTNPPDTSTGGDPTLVGRWLFDDGTANDSSGNSRHGQLELGVTIAANTGIRGGSLSTSGAGGVMKVPGLDRGAFPRSGTFAIWFKRAGGPTECSLFDDWDNNRNHLFVRHRFGAPEAEYQIAFQRPGTETEYLYRFVHEWNVVINEWVHLVVTWDEASRRVVLYRNGVVEKAGTFDAPFAPTDQAFTTGRAFVGYIDELVLYNRALTQTEALAIP